MKMSSMREMPTEESIRERVRRAYDPEYQAMCAEGNRDLERARAQDGRLAQRLRSLSLPDDAPITLTVRTTARSLMP